METEHLRPPPISELRQAPTSSPIVAGRRCPCPWLRRSSHVQRSASSPTAAVAYLDECLWPEAAPSSLLLLRADKLAHGLRPSPLPPGSSESCPVQHSTSSPTVAVVTLDELARGRIRCARGRGRLRARTKTPSRGLAPYGEPGTVILRASTPAGVRAAVQACGGRRRLAGGRSSGVSAVELHGRLCS